MAIRFNFQKQITLSNKRALKKFLKKIFDIEGKKVGSLDYVFCDDPHILGINQIFLKHDYFTDIITFDMTQSDANALAGEIYISIDTVATNSIKFKTDFRSELYRVMFHGVLHLCGYGDKSKNDQLTMRQKEDHYLAMFHREHKRNVPRGT